MLCERASHAADLRVRFSRQEPPLAVPLFPEAGRRKGEQWQSAPLPGHPRDHLVDERLVLEAVPAGESGLDQGPAQPALTQCPDWSEVREGGGERLVCVAAKEEVVPQRQDHVDVGVEDQPSQQASESVLHLGWIEGEQLLELIHDDEHVLVGRAETLEEL